uniref:Uncharacterized protein n=1 Tax=Rhipicephalus microplus TaxID=6941 RepID=A0A6G5AIS0_RHIMP
MRCSSKFPLGAFKCLSWSSSNFNFLMGHVDNILQSAPNVAALTAQKADILFVVKHGWMPILLLLNTLFLGSELSHADSLISTTYRITDLPWFMQDKKINECKKYSESNGIHVG